MAVEIQVTCGEGHICESVHAPSGTVLATDSPEDIGGPGTSFSPTDLVATALASCILTTIQVSAQRRELNIAGSTARVEKHMVADPQRRIGRLPVTITMCAGIPEEFRARFEKIAHTCPVHRSLGENVDAPIEFVWPD